MGSNKLLKEIKGKPMIRGTVEAVLQSHASPVVVVTGHDEGQVREALKDLPVAFTSNPDFADGLSTSLAAGVAKLPATADGAQWAPNSAHEASDGMASVGRDQVRRSVDHRTGVWVRYTWVE